MQIKRKMVCFHALRVFHIFLHIHKNFFHKLSTYVEKTGQFWIQNGKAVCAKGLPKAGEKSLRVFHRKNEVSNMFSIGFSTNAGVYPQNDMWKTWINAASGVYKRFLIQFSWNDKGTFKYFCGHCGMLCLSPKQGG